MTADPAIPEIALTDPIAAGDASAGAGDWIAAVAWWESALSGHQSEQAVERLRWFLEQEAPIPTNRPSSRKNVLLAGIGSALMGTGVVFLAQSTEGTMSTLLSILIWMLYGVAAVTAIIYARLSGPTLNHPSPIDLTAARHAAAALQENHAPNAGNVAR